MKQWNIGNTTIRNPQRIKDGLELLKKFEGKSWDYDLQREFYDEANKRGIMESDGSKVKEKELHARKWVSCLNQLGFARAWKSEEKGPVEITDVGNQLVNDEITFEEAMLRQLLKYQLPSPIESGKNYESFHVHPFRVFLEIIYGLYRQDVSGLTKEEIGLFVITNLKDEDCSESIEEIVKYRSNRASIKGKNPKLKFFRDSTKAVIARNFAKKLGKAEEVLKRLMEQAKKSKSFLKSSEFISELRTVLFGKEPKKQRMTDNIRSLITKGESFNKIFDYYLDEFVGTKGGTLKDYADSQVRYVMTTGLFSLNRDRIVIKPNKLDLIKAILAEPPVFFDGDKYLDYFYNSEMPKLPLDDADFMVMNIGDLQQQLERLSEKTGLEVEPLMTVERSVPKLKKVNQQLEKELIRQKEYLFYKDQGTNEQIDDIIDYFERIKTRDLLGGDAYFPAYYEWAIWRVFLAINTLVGAISDTRNFEIDEELKPIHHAKGGVPDMVFNYDDFVIVCEATLHQSVSQWAAEYTSVPKHVGQISSETKKPVFGIFVAPKIEPNMAQTLFKADWHVNGEFVDLNIIPFSTDQLIGVLKFFAKKKFSVQDLKVALEKLIKIKKIAANGKEWYEEISSTFPFL
ncbi:MAG: AlwI family type II restriction endonuclease [Candidatus Gracilibacteria bacterium]|jgi:hypothetical protein|nr:AlwI family type II restriction endonuclease [Candidatus Gracilibacteria bacterium]